MKVVTRSRTSPPSPRSWAPTTHRLQRKCACGGTLGPTGECEGCRKKRLAPQRDGSDRVESIARVADEYSKRSLDYNFTGLPIQAGAENAPSVGSRPYNLSVNESAASEAEAEAIAEQIVAGETATNRPPVHRVSAAGGIQRQRRPEDILPRAHQPTAPTMRPVGAEIVRGFAVTRATCGCNAEVTAREKGNAKRIAAYTTCGQRKDVRDPFALEACVRKKIFGAAGPRVPALGTADPETSTVKIADAKALALREKMLGEPAEGPCVALQTRAMLVHEGKHLEQFDEVAKSISSAFFAEFKRLEGDTDRMTKLAAKFPNETKKYENEWQRSVATNVRAETESYTAELDFYSEVRSAWGRVCGSAVPTPSVAPPQGAPGRAELQRCATTNNSNEQIAVPDMVHDVVRSSGQPLDSATRTFMAQRFGHDFGRVRVHTDVRANESARAVNAHAYTVGEHLVFDAGRYSPATSAGQRLLAHELAHVVQQRAGGSRSLQRDDKPPAERIDVALVFGEQDTAMLEGRSYAPTALRVTSCEEAKKKLLALGKPLGRVYIVAHGNDQGEIEIDSVGGKIHVKLTECSKDLKGMPANIAPTDLDFRACKLGEAPKELEAARKNVGAKRAHAGNCWSLVRALPPAMHRGAPLTSESQIREKDRASVDADLKASLNKFKTDDGHSLKNCLSGLAAGETADGNFAKIRRQYFTHHGNLSAVWASPNYDFTWQKGSICVKDMTATTSPCKIVTASESDTGGGAETKSGALEPQPHEMQLAGAATAAGERDQTG